jgi:uncharacterized membrane protein YsdA (DUF1294 family)
MTERRNPKTTLRGTVGVLALASTFFGLLTYGASLGRAPWILVLVYAIASGAAFVVVGLDKAAARKGRHRTAENTLHVMSLAGGWPGAWVAQQVFRHKTQKQPFQFLFYSSAAINCAGLAWFLHYLR